MPVQTEAQTETQTETPQLSRRQRRNRRRAINRREAKRVTHELIRTLTFCRRTSPYPHRSMELT
jgi:hypothetical protein